MNTKDQFVAESMGLKIANLELELAEWKMKYQELRQEKEKLERLLEADNETG